MARAPKNGNSGPTETVATTLLMPPANLIQSLSKAKSAARKQARDATQTFSQKFSKAQDEKHVDRRAANIAFNLDSLDDKTLHVTIYHLLRYMDDLGIMARAKAQNEMFDAAETGPGLNGSGKKKGENVTSVGAAARRVMEQAGGTPSSE